MILTVTVMMKGVNESRTTCNQATHRIPVHLASRGDVYGRGVRHPDWVLLHKMRRPYIRVPFVGV